MDSLTEIYNEISQEEPDFEMPTRRVQDKPITAKTYMASVIEEIEKLIEWDNNTLVKDRPLIWMKMTQLYKKKSDTGVRVFIDWCRGKKLWPKQVVVAINKALTKIN